MIVNHTGGLPGRLFHRRMLPVPITLRRSFAVEGNPPETPTRRKPSAAGGSELRWNVARSNLVWQSKAILLIVTPVVGVDVALETQRWAARSPSVAVSVLGASALLGFLTLILRAATPGAAATGAAITAGLMYSTAALPFAAWRTALMPILAVSLLAFASTRTGRRKKEQLGIAEQRRGRMSAQVAANLGLAALAASDLARSWSPQAGELHHAATLPTPILAAALAALAEAAADTVSSELGQVLGGRPFMITSLRRVEPGRDGAVSLAGTLSGIMAAGIVAAVGALALSAGLSVFWISTGSAVFGLLVDSILGATLEQRGMLNNDAVNFLSTAAAAMAALMYLKFM